MWEVSSFPENMSVKKDRSKGLSVWGWHFILGGIFWAVLTAVPDSAGFLLSIIVRGCWCSILVIEAGCMMCPVVLVMEEGSVCSWGPRVLERALLRGDFTKERKEQGSSCSLEDRDWTISV